MKSCIFALFASALAFAQTKPANPPAAAQAPSTPGTSEQLQPRGPEAVAQQDPKRVVAVVNGQNLTAGEAAKLISLLRANYGKDVDRDLPRALQQVFVMRHLADEAEKEHLDQQAPWKDQIDFTRQNLLARAYMVKAANAYTPTPEERRKYYDEHKPQFDEVQLSGIVITFNPGPGAPPAANGQNTKNRTEAQAKAKAEELETKLKGGADFAALAKTESDDARTAANGGVLGRYTAATNLQPGMREEVFKLSPGQITPPIREPNAYYILKVTGKETIAYERADQQILEQLRQQKNQQMLQSTAQQYQLQVQDQNFFSVNAGAPGATQHTPSLANPTRQPGQPTTKPNGAANSSPSGSTR